MERPIMLAFALALLAWFLVIGDRLRIQRPDWHWYLTGYPRTLLRIVFTWRKVALINDLSVSYGSSRRAFGDMAVKGVPLRRQTPRISFPRPIPGGLELRARLRPGQTPAPFLEATEALAHAWRVHAVRVVAPERGEVAISVTARDPLEKPHAPSPGKTWRLLSAVVGALETGGTWVIDFRRIPHWPVVGATRSGKSTLLARLVTQLAPQPVALVGIDCKGGMELGLFGERFSALAASRSEAVAVLGGLVTELQERMQACRLAGARSIWELAEQARPVPVVVLVDELAELYLSNGSKEDRAEAEQCSTYLLRLVVIHTVADIAAGLLALWIVLYLLDANQGNVFVQFVRDSAHWLSAWSQDIFTMENDHVRLALNYGLPAVVYLFIGHGIAAKIRHG
ncbi:cell division protein FtsK [Streptomyces sp. HNM0575]|uniref:FtsK/SpoIIIE domain-containing protein n=1 Tax=Streptomyces sp. HNM0575 TaxID=2716338 RepID=UPI00145E6300|nr:FtsK/SpoIIIE domain-containing protein [Streptomyces sp. HNM0575]NLU76146.1 cell division protein FtsK [Streptomyces sp. HNM0575]